VPAGRSERFTAYRHHAVFTNSPLSMHDAEGGHRDHAIIEQVIADLKGGSLAHMPFGVFSANTAWTRLAAIAFNLTCAASVLASAFHAKATTATIRAQLITVSAGIARSARRLRMHLPQHALGERLEPAVHHRLRPTGHSHPLTTQPQAPRRTTRSGKTGQTGSSLMPPPADKIIRRQDPAENGSTADRSSADADLVTVSPDTRPQAAEFRPRGMTGFGTLKGWLAW